MDEIVSTKIRNLNVLMTSLIVLLHSTIPSTFFYNVAGTICDSAVPVFFTISSFLYFKKWDFSWACYRRKTWTRFKSLLVPFLLYNILFYIYYIITAKIFNLFPQKDIALNVYDAFIYIWNSNADTPLWYLKSLFIFFLFAPILGAIVKKTKYSFILVFVALLTKDSSYSSPLFWFPCIITGCYVSIHYETIKQYYLKHKSVLNGNVPTFISMFFFIIATTTFFSLTNRSHNSFYYCYRILSPLFIFAMYFKYSLIPSKIAKKINPYTFFIYCMHFPIIEIFKGIAKKASFLNSFSTCLFFLASLFTCILIGYILKKNRLCWHILNGFR